VNTGASVLAIEFEGGVAIAADTLCSYGRTARYGHVSRLFRANNQTIMGVSGDYADYEFLRTAVETKM